MTFLPGYHPMNAYIYFSLEPLLVFLESHSNFLGISTTKLMGCPRMSTTKLMGCPRMSTTELMGCPRMSTKSLTTSTRKSLNSLKKSMSLLLNWSSRTLIETRIFLSWDYGKLTRMFAKGNEWVDQKTRKRFLKINIDSHVRISRNLFYR
jgi:hypothetical protein